MISAALVALAFGSQLVVSVADSLPAFDSEPSCRAAAVMTTAGFDSCMNDEKSARAMLQSQWDQFSASERTSCVETTTTGGPPSYVELLTCLQMARDARNLPADKTDGVSR